MAPPPPPERYNVLGVGISALTLPDACRRILGVRGSTRHGYICLATAHGLTEARADSDLRRIYNRSWLTTPDGMPVVWLGPRGVGRVYGPDLMLAVCDAGRASGLTHYFYGGVPGVAARLAARLSERFPGLAVAGCHSPPFRPLAADEFRVWQGEIARLRPDVLWVGLGTPKQERFMAAHWNALEAGVLIGVGAAFDFHSGRLPQAPPWVRRSGLEWLFRLGVEPRRLAPRYFRTNPEFLLRVFAQWAGLASYPIE